jgi:hypothetical protein
MYRIGLCYTPWRTDPDRWFDANPSWVLDGRFACSCRNNALMTVSFTNWTLRLCTEAFECFDIVGNGNDNSIVLWVWVGVVVSISPVWQILTRSGTLALSR